MLKISFDTKIIARKFAAFGFSYYLCTEILRKLNFLIGILQNKAKINK